MACDCGGKHAPVASGERHGDSGREKKHRRHESRQGHVEKTKSFYPQITRNRKEEDWNHR
jgi:hypothetical protein